MNFQELIIRCHGGTFFGYIQTRDQNTLHLGEHDTLAGIWAAAQAKLALVACLQ